MTILMIKIMTRLFDQLLLKKAREFGKEYFDGERLYGYGGYKYNKKYWYKATEDIVNYYNLTENSSISILMRKRISFI